MASRFFAIGILGALATIGAGAVNPTLRQVPLRAHAVPGSAQLHAFGSRSAQQRQSESGAKFDAALADLSRHAALARPGHVLQDLRSMGQGARFMELQEGMPLVSIDAVTRGDPQELKAALLALGLQRAAVYSNDVGGWLPVAQLDAAAARAEVHSMRAAMSRTRSGAVTSQGDFVQHSDVVRSANSLTGAGVMVGVLSDSFDCYATFAANGVAASGADGYASNGFLATAATDIASGDLPSNVDVLEEGPCVNPDHTYVGYPLQLPVGDEGRAMLQVVHDVAPGASLAFYTGNNSEADFANGIGALATAGAKIVADDLGYFDEPFFQDGILAQAIDAVEAQGVAYFSAAGNDGVLSYDNLAPSFSTVSNTAPNSGEHLLNFAGTATPPVTSLQVNIPALVPGEFVAVVVEWDQPYVTGAPNSGGATSTIDVCVTGASGNDTTIYNYNLVPANCTGANALGADPYQVMIVGNPANAAGGANTSASTVNIMVGLTGGATPGRIKVVVDDDGAGSSFANITSSGATLQGHPGAAGAAAVAAAFYFNTPACGLTPAELEGFSSEGGAPILFDSAGNLLATPVVRQKPDFVGPDGGNDTFLGFTLASAMVTGSDGLLPTTTAACQNDPSYPNFFGTSAATPHVASIAALILQANPGATPSQIYQALRASALPMTSAGTTPNFDTGYGFVQADAALAMIPPGPPTLSLAKTSVTAGTSTTLSWSSVNASSCTASGSWSGTLAASGTQTVTPSAAGTSTYSLTCANVAGTSAATAANLTVTPASSGGGGGELGGLTLLGLAGLACARIRRLGLRRRAGE